MGGMGSGRRFQSNRGTTDGRLRLDIRRLQHAGRLREGNTFTWRWTWGDGTSSAITVRVEADHVVLSYRNRRGGSDEWQPMEYPVQLDWTTPHYGGRRPWFLCPERDCGRRVAVLYGGRVFACRQCQELAYASQRETGLDRTFRQADRLRTRLRWKPGIVYGPGPKPKGMHWRTFDDLSVQYDVAAQALLAGITHKFNSINDRLERLVADLRACRRAR